MTYAKTVAVRTSFTETVGLVRDALGAQGFGILSEIDVHATLEAKLGDESARSIGDYLILGACNPVLAHRALAADPSIGVLLPCNVVVRRAPGDGQTTVQAIDPATMVGLSGGPGIGDIAAEASTRLDAALDALTVAVAAGGHAS